MRQIVKLPVNLLDGWRDKAIDYISFFRSQLTSLQIWITFVMQTFQIPGTHEMPLWRECLDWPQTRCTRRTSMPIPYMLASSIMFSVPTYKRHRCKINNTVPILRGQGVLEEPIKPAVIQQHEGRCRGTSCYMKHPNPSRIAPNDDATSSTLTPNWFESNTYPGPTMGDSAPSRVAANALIFVWMVQNSSKRLEHSQSPKTCFLLPSWPI